MPRWFRWPRRDPQWPALVTDATPGVGFAADLLDLPPEPPPGVDGALWASWAARWQEF